MKGFVHSQQFYKPGRIMLNTEAIASRRTKEKILSNDLQLIYSALCISLHEEKGMDTDELAEFLNAVQSKCVWLLQNYPTREEWVKHCEDVTGIALQNGD